jgi:dipeptidyl aminopeptidase/acylaminoacyl peptidase
MRTRVQIRLAVLMAASLAAGVQARAQEPVVTRYDDALRALFGVREFQEAEVSPDGTRVTWVESIPEDEDSRSTGLAIYAVEVSAPERAVRISAGDGKSSYEEHDLAWSPAGDRLAFLSDAGQRGQLQLWVADPTNGASKQLTHLRGHLARPSWSPDGKTIGLLFTEDLASAAAPIPANSPEVVSEESSEQRVALIDVAAGTVRQVSPADMHVYEFDWAPDSQRMVVTSVRGSGSNNWWIANLFVLDVSSGGMKPFLDQPRMQVGMPRWAPDNSRIAFIGGLMSDQPVVGGDVYVVPATGGVARNLTPEMKMTANSITWAQDSGSLFFGGISSGQTVISTLGLDGKISNIWTGAERIAPGRFNPRISLSRDGKVSAAIRQSFAAPPEVWAGPVGKWKQITHRNEALRSAWGKAENLHWTTDIGEVQGWLIYPRDFDPTKKYPMVVDVHGGPAAAALPGWPGRRAFAFALPSRGYFLLLPNPRGSYGGGEKFVAGNVKDFGYGDFRDILGGVEEAIKRAPVDPSRVGITGWSYGGYMTMWAVTQTNRFKAAVAGAGLANWLSYYGENKIDQWMPPYFGATVYDDPAIYARSSPITFIKNAKTPTLIIVGDRDISCPAPQSYEFWHGLKTLGVPVELRVYPNEGHFFADRGHNWDVIARVVAWFDQYLGGAQ